ncbi:MAG: hypothetical protein IPK13_26400 [Deltaproteobacteria bacterium]|nr:hypothetical protein [Deltaproteobacteria bacterium]
MSLELLKAVMTYRPPKKLHPVGRLLAQLFEESDGHLDEAALSQVRTAVEACYGDLKALSDANCALLAFIKLARESWDRPEAADAVGLILSETFTQYTGLFDQLALAVAQLPQDVAEHATALFERFVGQEKAPEAKKAPTGEEIAPVNSIPLRKLVAPRPGMTTAGAPRPGAIPVVPRRRPPVRPKKRGAARG